MSFRPFVIASIFAVFLACAAQSAERFERRELTIESTGADGAVSISAELAVTHEQRQQGLMNRTELPDGEGMLFIFERDQILSFWMKDTLIPLSIAFIASDGRIVEIFDMEPLNLNAIRSSRSVRYALEVPQNWFQRAGVAPGDRLILGDFNSRSR
ncbi:MAG: DUF192 domain-containing protein [Treponema sp.]|nr:DUF192 domain-containing protein [Treponema sp.]